MEKSIKKLVKQDNNDEELDLNESVNKTIFISGIPYTATSDDIRKIFDDCGKIEELKIPKYQDSGKNRGYAHLTFKKTSSIAKALLKNKTYIGERYITVEVSKGENITERKVDSSEVPEDCKTILIKNLPYDISEEQLANKFKPCGDIKSIRMVYHSKLNHFKGFAFIDFEKSDSVKIAINLNGKELNGRKMTVDYEDGKPKLGYKFRSNEPSKYNREFNELKTNTLRKKRQNN